MRAFPLHALAPDLVLRIRKESGTAGAPIAGDCLEGRDLRRFVRHHEEGHMPEVIVYAVEGRSLEQKKGLVKDITNAIVKNFDVEADAVTVQIVEAPRTDKAKGGVLFSERPPAKR
jgi:4-oxalocrotonate tautomerase